ncbi:DUF6114 domain-containing protein [Streptomyces natalensis]|uniref:Membrane protein n=1 Tax=Streptomyces natalensis ATCC 27448 TaxID=1240678 RepID=A0A0D7CDS3_9ACTN|nr:DUF6114 domain-containing protein [Streptomyces natalensis]KIZ14055.1 membrane protein [Streptomyces natalensis ATCC 27448]
MSADTRPRLIESIGQKRRSFGEWRGRRPFWGGMLTLLAGVPIMYFPYAHLSLGGMTLSMATTAGAGSLIIGVLLVVLGLTMWFQPVSRVFAGVAAILLSLVSFVVSNFGGFVVGLLLGLIGGALAVAWAPGKPLAEGDDGEQDRKVIAGPVVATNPAPATGGGSGLGFGLGDLSGTSPNDGLNGRHRAG